MSKRKATNDIKELSAKIPRVTNAEKIFDYFSEHFCQSLPENLATHSTDEDKRNERRIKLEAIDNRHVAHFMDSGFELHWNKQDSPALSYENALLHKRLTKYLSASEQNQTEAEIYGVLGRYISLCCVSKSLNYLNAYCIHALNHILRTRTIIIDNQKKLDTVGVGNVTDDLVESTRDQGFTRTKILILTPFKKFAYRIVDTMANLLLADERNYVMNWAKFAEEYGDDGTKIHEKWRSTSEFKELMSGNIDDSFRIGLSLGKKAFKLYTAFENSDIIIASPLGLRMIIGDEEEESNKREFDFLSSIEVLIIDRADVLFMQNWEHLLVNVGTLNVVPKNIANDISRVRHWILEGQGPLYRQIVAFSEINFTELRILFAKYDRNFAGLFTLTNIPPSLLPEIEIPIVQEMHRFSCTEPEKQSDLRFDYFIHNVLPKLKTSTLVFISSYFDYIRLRNYLKKENESFAQIHEYASKGKVKKSRKAFANHERKLLLITERVHFFRHFFVKGVKSIVFYQLPINSNFYTQFINMTEGEDKVHCRVLYSLIDMIRLQNVFGPKYAKELLQSEKKFHVIVSE